MIRLSSNHSTGASRPPESPLALRLAMAAAVFAISLLLAALFAPTLPIRLVLAVPGALLLGWGLRSLSGNRKRNDRREQYRALLSHLLSQASIGRSLEQALATARSALAADYPPRHPFGQILQQVEHQVLGNQPAATVVEQLVESLDCPEATVGLGILRRITLSGTALVTFLRRADQSLADLIEISRDIAAQHARTAAEAAILGVMPFVLAVLLHQSGGYFEPALAHPAGILILGASYLVAMLALAIIPGAKSPQGAQKPKGGKQAQGAGQPRGGRQMHGMKPPALEPASGRRDPSAPPQAMAGPRRLAVAAQLHKLLTRLWGESRSRRIDEALLRVYDDSSQARTAFDVQKLNLLLAGLALGVLLAIAAGMPLLFPAPAVLLVLLQDQQLFREARQEELQLLAAFPFFLHVCVSLLEAGLTMHPVLELTTAAFTGADPAGSNSPMARDARRISQGLRAGWPAERVLSQLAAQSSTAELRAAYHLLVRYSQLGGSELLQQLLQQTQACWTVYRNASRSRMDEQSMRMLVPMMLDLLAILAISLAPALILLGTSL